MSTGALSNDEVANEMNKMVAFIKQEANEKAREVRIKADEEFAIEKAKLVKQEQQNIDALYEKKRKGAEVAQKISQSTQNNKSRLRILQRHNEHVQSLFDAAREQLLELSKDSARYSQFLESLILQGTLQLMEPTVIVSARSKDTSVVEKAAEGAKVQYKEISGRDVSYSINGDLSDILAGGVKIASGDGRISLDNTLDERLRLLEDRMLPEIRVTLFGANENRKFDT